MPLTLPELAELALFLVDEGITHQNNGQHAQALVRYTQSLSVFRALNTPNETWVAFLFYNLGQIKAAYRKHTQAKAFYECANWVQLHLAQDQAAADMLRQTGQAALKLQAYAHAQDWLERAADLYQAFGTVDVATAVRAEIRSVPKRIVPLSHSFEIWVGEERRHQCRIGADGVVQWSPAQDIISPAALGLIGWDILCVDDSK